MDERPEFLVALGLAPPVSVEDVKQAFWSKVKAVHPDHGGKVQDFIRLNEAFKRALEYAEFRTDRRKWLAVQVERYAGEQAVVEQLRAFGGTVEYQPLDWMRRSFGEDFAQIMDRLVGIRLRGERVTDAALELLVHEQRWLPLVERLDLAESRVTDRGVMMLGVFQSLVRLDLTGTAVTDAVLSLADALPKLNWLGTRQTQIGWLPKVRTRWSHPHLQLI